MGLTAEGKAGVPDTPWWRPSGGRLDTSSLYARVIPTLQRKCRQLPRGGEAHGWPVLVLAPMRCLKPGPRALQQDGLPLHPHFLSFLDCQCPTPLPSGASTANCLGLRPPRCIPCWRTSHPAADLEQRQKTQTSRVVGLAPPPSPCFHSFSVPMEYVFLVNEKAAEIPA